MLAVEYRNVEAQVEALADIVARYAPIMILAEQPILLCAVFVKCTRCTDYIDSRCTD